MSWPCNGSASLYIHAGGAGFSRHGHLEVQGPAAQVCMTMSVFMVYALYAFNTVVLQRSTQWYGLFPACCCFCCRIHRATASHHCVTSNQALHKFPSLRARSTILLKCLASRAPCCPAAACGCLLPRLLQAGVELLGALLPSTLLVARSPARSRHALRTTSQVCIRGMRVS